MNYFYYQLIGGNEDWKGIQADNLAEINPRPTFVTILATDTIFVKDMSRDLRDKAKYLGPMYFDLDSTDVDDSLSGARDLLAKLRDLGLDDGDMAIYLSGKKGVHFVIPQKVFFDKVNLLQRLPAIYKELAFQLAVDCLDFAVYTGGMGRMFRTCHNIRENGNYKVRISSAELLACTAEGYDQLCSAPRPDPSVAGNFRAKLGMLFDAARQKVTKLKPKKIQQVDAATLKRHQPTVKRLLDGKVVDGVGFNKIAIQLALYAREMGMNPDSLIAEADGVLDNHNSDSYRYNTRSKRERELRRMCAYVEDNSVYDYSIDPIKSMLVKVEGDTSRSSNDEEDSEDISGGVVQRSGSYWVLGSGESPDKCILSASFTNSRVLYDTKNGSISCLIADLMVSGIARKLSIERSDFSSSTSLHRLTSQHGVSFMGTDINARGIYELMIRNIEPNQYVTECEGLDVVRIPTSQFEEARQPFLIWADYKGVKLPRYIEELGISFQFQGFPDPGGVIRTDLSNAPALRPWTQKDDNMQRLTEALVNMFKCQSIEVTSKILGWNVACFWRQLFHEAFGKFPLMHINGPAGSGKTEYTSSFLSLFYYTQQPRVITPTSTVYSIQSMIAGSASIPILVDEYKPQEMDKNKHNAIKLLFRDAYNKRETSRGGGNRTKENYNALSSSELSAPICFIAEAIENETALLERVVLVTMKRQPTLVAARNYKLFQQFYNNRDVLSVVGANIAANITKSGSVEGLREEFSKIYDAARIEYMLQDGDIGRLSDEEIAKKANGRERLVYNNSVAAFGLYKFEQLLRAVYEDQYENLFGAYMVDARKKVFSRMDDSVKSTLPEYIKVLLSMSDMSRVDPQQSTALLDGTDFMLTEEGGKPVLHLVTRACYAKYRAWMRNQGQAPLYSNEMAFMHSLSDAPQFMRYGNGTRTMKADSVVLDYTAMLRTGLPAFTGKIVAS